MAHDDLVEKALDAAMDKIDAETPDEPVAESVQEEAEPTLEPVAEEQSEEAEQISGEEANVEEDKASEGAVEAEKPAEPEAEPIEIPTFLPAETKALLAEASPALRKNLIAAYNQQENTVRRALSESGTLKAEKARVDEVFAPHKTRLQAQGVKDIADLASRALAWDELITKDPKAFVIAQMRQNGITPQDLLEDTGNDPGQQYTDPRVDEALERAERAEKAFEEFQANQTKAQLASELETFKNGKDSTGLVRRQFVEMLEPQIARTVAAIKADPEYQHLTNEQVLHHAYEYEVSQARSGFKAVAPVAPKPMPTKEEVEKQAAKQKAATGSVRGAPASGTSTPRPRLKGNSFEEKLNSALDIGMSRTATNR